MATIAARRRLYALHLKVTGETLWRSDHPFAILGFLLTLGRSQAGLAAALRLHHGLISRFGTRNQRRDQNFWDRLDDDVRRFRNRPKPEVDLSEGLGADRDPWPRRGWAT